MFSCRIVCSSFRWKAFAQIVMRLQKQKRVGAFSMSSHVARDVPEESALVLALHVWFPIHQQALEILEVRHNQVEELGMCCVIKRVLENTLAIGEAFHDCVVEHP